MFISYIIIFDIFDAKKEIPQKKLLTITKFANAVGVPVSTIRYWVKVGKLKPTMYTESGYMMFSKSLYQDLQFDLLSQLV